MRKFRRGASFVKHAQCSTRLDRNDKARIIYLAEKTELRTKAKGRKAGAIGQGGLQVLRCLLHQFHNTSTGQCDPGYTAIQARTPRLQILNPSNITCGSPATNNQGNGTVLLKGVLKPATAPYGQVLDVNHITQSAAFPLEIFKTTIHKGNYISARCNAANKLWNLKTTWTYNDNTKKTVTKTQPCTIG